MDEDNPYKPSVVRADEARKRNFMMPGAGLLIAIGLIVAIAKAVVEMDWLLGLAIFLMLSGSWLAAVASRTKPRRTGDIP